MDRPRRTRKRIILDLPLGDESDLENESEEDLQDVNFVPKSSRNRKRAPIEPDIDDEDESDKSDDNEESIPTSNQQYKLRQKVWTQTTLKTDNS